MAEDLEKKTIFQKWWFWIIILLIIIIVVITSIILVYKKLEGIGSAGISKAEFEKIEMGMDNFEVNSIIDELDEWNDDEIYEKACKEMAGIPFANRNTQIKTTAKIDTQAVRKKRICINNI